MKSTKVILENADNYKTLIGLLPDLINISGYRNDSISGKMGLNAATFSAKKQRGNWSPDEMIKLVSIIDNEDVEDFLTVELMRKTKDEPTVSADEFRKEMKLP